MSTMTHATTTRRIVRAEWTKLRTLPSTWRTAVLTMVMAIGFGVAVAFSEAGQWHTMTAQQRQVFDLASASMVGVMIAAVVLGALAVKTVTSEYSTGMCGHPAATPDLCPYHQADVSDHLHAEREGLL